MSRWYDDGEELLKFFLMEEICWQLIGVFGHDRDESVEIFKKYCEKHPDDGYDDFSHQGEFHMAMEMHYSIVMGLDLFTDEYILWRSGFRGYVPKTYDLNKRFREKLCDIFSHNETNARDIVRKYHKRHKKKKRGVIDYLQISPTRLAVGAQYEVWLNGRFRSPEHAEWFKQLSPKDWSI